MANIKHNHFVLNDNNTSEKDKLCLKVVSLGIMDFKKWKKLNITYNLPEDC